MKNPKTLETLKEILRKNRMSTRPEFYSGRGVNYGDLNEEILIGIYYDVQKTFGKRASEGFVDLMRGIKTLSATAFLEDLYSLFYSDWKYCPEHGSNGIAVHKNENGEYNLASGMASMFSALNNKPEVNERATECMRASFLRQTGQMNEKDLKKISGPSVIHCTFGDNLIF